MRQIWISRFGPPEVLLPKETEDPSPGKNQLRLRVKASGVNFADILARWGRYPEAPPPPLVVGYEVAGEVDAVGEGVSHTKIGDRILAPCLFGGYSDTVLVAENLSVKIPEKMDFATAAVLPVNYGTAYGLIHHCARLQQGDTVLVYSLGGGVGLALLEFCLLKGVELIGVASQSKHSRLRDLGATHLIDPLQQDLETEVQKLIGSRGFDFIFDCNGGESWARGMKWLSPFGSLIAFGNMQSIEEAKGGVSPHLQPKNNLWYSADLFSLMKTNRGIKGFNLVPMFKQRPEEFRAWMVELLELWEQGKIHPHVDRQFPLGEAAAAHSYIEERRNFGKVILKI